jgi:hypothetical protein
MSTLQWLERLAIGLTSLTLLREYSSLSRDLSPARNALTVGASPNSNRQVDTWRAT